MCDLRWPHFVRIISLLVGLLTIAACARAENPAPGTYEERLRLFDYDRAQPLDIQILKAVDIDGVQVQHITYASPKGGMVSATLVVPPGEGPFAGVILQHGMEGSRMDMLGFAKELAPTGAVVLLIDAPWARFENRYREAWPLTFTETDREEQIQLIVDLQRGVDLLTARPDVDAARLGYIGISYGGAMGGLLAGVERRIRAYVLAVGDGGLVEHFTGEDGRLNLPREIPDEQGQRWAAVMAPVEPLQFVGHAAPASLLFQAGRDDEAVPAVDAERYQVAGSEPKVIRWYDSGHRLPEEAIRDRVRWLQEQIGIDAQRFEG